jgi:chromate transport protein ChrA
MKRMLAKTCSVALLLFLAYAALGPANWQLRPMLGWKTEHFLGFFVITLVTCLAWPSLLIVGAALMAAAALFEILQGLTPDRTPDLMTAVCGAGGALLASATTTLLRTMARPN